MTLKAIQLVVRPPTEDEYERLYVLTASGRIFFYDRPGELDFRGRPVVDHWIELTSPETFFARRTP